MRSTVASLRRRKPGRPKGSRVVNGKLVLPGGRPVKRAMRISPIVGSNSPDVSRLDAEIAKLSAHLDSLQLARSLVVGN